MRDNGGGTGLVDDIEFLERMRSATSMPMGRDMEGEREERNFEGVSGPEGVELLIGRLVRRKGVSLSDMGRKGGVKKIAQRLTRRGNHRLGTLPSRRVGEPFSS